MTYLIASLWLPLLLSAAIGFVVGGWIWRYASEDELDHAPASAPIIPPAPPEIEPEPEPAPDLPAMEEPVAEAEPKPEPEPVQAPSPFLAAPNGEPDNLMLIKGVGPKLSDMLHELGVFHFAQIAAWDVDQVSEVDSQLGNFKGRVSRDRWVDQARMLANRDVAAFEREFGKMNDRL